MATYRSIAPSASSLLTRVQQEDGERPTFVASSLLVRRPSLIRADRILRSIKSRRLFFTAGGFTDAARPIKYSSRNLRLQTLGNYSQTGQRARLQFAAAPTARPARAERNGIELSNAGPCGR